ncbi:hypothetical protein PHJA_000081800 [Phtheirospermum japonicum]|uniref:Uncharacterized protein n=1 Tax=Phtheirospermum japonicum TaxID=374723 RepID=A0A830B418_9LAMI|nr:hypothetical protein PHJA_000081800 [Phtheirospermum japonicum]
MCRGLTMLDDPAVFNNICPELAREVSDKLRKEFTLEKVHDKIHMLCVHYNMFLSFCQRPGVRLCRRWGRVNVMVEYYDHIGEDVVLHLPGGDPEHPMVVNDDDASSETDNEGMAFASAGDPVGGPFLKGGLRPTYSPTSSGGDDEESDTMSIITDLWPY